MKLTLAQMRRIIKEEIAAQAAPAGAVKRTQLGKLGERSGREEEEDLDESQRGNDENGQHDNDTEPGDPHVKRLAEAALSDILRARALLKRI